MNSFHELNSVLLEDLEYLSNESKEDFNQFEGKTIMVTGSTGLVARVLIYSLLFANKKFNLNLQVLAIARNKKKAQKKYANFLDNSALKLIFQDISEPFQFEQKVDFIFHAAAVTDSKTLIKIPVEVFEAQSLGMMNILALAKKDKAKVLYFSSMEIYGQPFTNGQTEEHDLGFVDPLVIRNGYPEAKRANEFLAAAYAQEFNVQVVNARLAQTFGPGVDFDDSRVFAQFIRNALQGKDLILHTDGSSLGNYCYLRDTIAALLLLINCGNAGESYNIVNEKTNVSIKQMAEMVSTNFGNGRVIIDIPDEDMGYAPKVNLHLSGEKLRALGWHSNFDLKQMFERTISSFKVR